MALISVPKAWKHPYHKLLVNLLKPKNRSWPAQTESLHDYDKLF